MKSYAGVFGCDFCGCLAARAERLTGWEGWWIRDRGRGRCFVNGPRAVRSIFVVSAAERGFNSRSQQRTAMPVHNQ